MSYSVTATTKNASNRFMLVRVTPCRLISLDLASLGAGLYSASYPSLHVVGMQRNGVDLTKVTTVAGNDQWSFDDSSGALNVQLASAPNETGNLVTIFYSLYYTGSHPREAPHTPTDSSTATRTWDPRIDAYPTVSQSCTNVLAGTLTINQSTITLLDADYAFRSYLGPKDSLKGREIAMWLCVDSTADIALVFKGTVSAVTTSGPRIMLSCLDGLDALRQPCFMGDTANDCYVNITSNSYPNADPNVLGKVVPYFVGRFSRHGIRQRTTPDGQYGLDVSTMPQAFCSNFNSVVASTTNRSWVAGRVSSNGLRTFTLPSPDNGTLFFASNQWSAATGTTSAYNYTVWSYLTATWATITDVTIGDVIQVTGSAKTDWFLIVAMDSTAKSVTLYQLSNNGASITTITGPSDPDLILVDDAGHEYPLAPGRDFTTTLTALPSGNKRVDITFVNNFEANLTTLNGYPSTFVGWVNPQRHQLYYRLRTDTTSAKHGSVLSQILTSVGLTVDSSSVTTANTALPVNCSFSVPFADETEVGTADTYAQAILSSTLGVVYTDLSGSMQYKLLSYPSSGSSVDDSIFLRDSLTVDVVYDDTLRTVRAVNDHILNPMLNVNSSVYRSSAYAQYLHQTGGETKFTHVLDDITQTIGHISGLRGTRRVMYTLDTAVNNIGSLIGDQFTLTTPQALGGTGTVNLTILETVKSAAKTTVVACDLEGMQ